MGPSSTAACRAAACGYGTPRPAPRSYNARAACVRSPSLPLFRGRLRRPGRGPGRRFARAAELVGELDALLDRFLLPGHVDRRLGIAPGIAPFVRGDRVVARL